jgi:hypothetical protein
MRLCPRWTPAMRAALSVVVIAWHSGSRSRVLREDMVKKRVCPESRSGRCPAGKRGTSMHESPVLVHVWEVDPAEQAVAVRRLNDMFAGIVNDPGFVSARVLETADQTSIAAIVEMRSVEDRQRLEKLPDVGETLHHLHGTANMVVRLYHDVGAYSA